MAAGMVLAVASCSTTDEPMAAGKSDIAIAVNAPAAAMSRATVELPAGYTMHCVMQLLDESNNAVGTQKTATIDAATGTGTFVITAADQELGVKALFWAEYIDAAGKSVYNTADLKAVSYNTTSFDLADAAAMAATDAFCGKLDALKNGANVTLLRPFSNINFVPANPDKVAAAKKMTVSYATPSAYNVFNGTAAETTAVTFTNASFDATVTPWFSTFVFAPVDQTSLAGEVSIALSDGLTQTITIESGSLPLNPNFQYTVSATIGDVELSDINISVGVEPGYSKPEFKVGGYVNAAGEPVANASEAAGIVFHVGAIGADATDLYDAKFAGKTIKGYAVALENASKTRQKLVGEDPVTGMSQTAYANGAQGTAAFLEAFAGSAFATAFTDWRSAHPTTGDNVTEWYIPSLKQSTEFFGMLYPSSAGVAATGSDSFKAMFPNSDMFDTMGTLYYAPCDFNSQGNVAAVRLVVAGEDPDWTISYVAAQMTTATGKNQSALCRPMITIFE